MTNEDALADLVWYVQGCIDTARLAHIDCLFSGKHTEALQEAIRLMSEPKKVEYCICGRGQYWKRGSHHDLNCPFYCEVEDPRCTCYPDAIPVDPAIYNPGAHHNPNCPCYRGSEPKLRCTCTTWPAIAMRMGTRAERGAHHNLDCPLYHEE